jgi:hypothetical protein
MSQTTFSNGLGYEGKVTLTLKSNNRVLESKTYKNHGTAQLFKFLGQCLIGSFEESKNLLPNKILLLKNTSGGAFSTAVSPCTTWQTLVKTPTIISEVEPAQVKIVYSFEISRAAIVDNFNQVALYGADITNYQEFSAYYYLTDPSGALVDQKVSEWSATTVLLIEWELLLSNKNE